MKNSLGLFFNLKLKNVLILMESKTPNFSITYESVDILLLESSLFFKQIKLIVFSNKDDTQETFIKYDFNFKYSKEQNVIPLILSGDNFTILITELNNNIVNIILNSVNHQEITQEINEKVSKQEEEDLTNQFETITNIFGSQEVNISDLQGDVSGTLDNVGYGLARLLSSKSLSEIKVPEKIPEKNIVNKESNIEFSFKKK